VSLSSGDEVPHISTRKSRLQPGEFLITSAKRLLQQYLPEAAVSNRSKTAALFDHLVGAREQRRRHFQANRLRHDQVNDEVELGRLLDRKIGGLRPPQNLVDQVAGAPLKSMKATVPTGVENSYFS
jgi:hypothetical protein